MEPVSLGHLGRARQADRPRFLRRGSAHERYKTWQHGSAKALAGQILPALRNVEAAGQLEDIPELNSAFKRAGHIAGELTAYPMPACADPKGYWAKMLGHLQAAGDNAGTSSGPARTG